MGLQILYTPKNQRLSELEVLATRIQAEEVKFDSLNIAEATPDSSQAQRPALRNRTRNGAIH